MSYKKSAAEQRKYGRRFIRKGDLCPKKKKNGRKKGTRTHTLLVTRESNACDNYLGHSHNMNQRVGTAYLLTPHNQPHYKYPSLSPRSTSIFPHIFFASPHPKVKLIKKKIKKKKNGLPD